MVMVVVMMMVMVVAVMKQRTICIYTYRSNINGISVVDTDIYIVWGEIPTIISGGGIITGGHGITHRFSF